MCVLVGMEAGWGVTVLSMGEGMCLRVTVKDKKETCRILAQHMTTIAVCELCLEQGTN